MALLDPTSPENDHGYQHNTILGVAKDTEHAIKVMPSLMRTMLIENGWRKFNRPIDGKQFTNRNISDWVLGPSYAGIGFPNWATVYAILRCDPIHGAACRELLIREGAPDIPDSMLPVIRADGTIEAAPERLDPSEYGKMGGRGKKAVDNINGFQAGGTAASYLAARLKRDHPEIAHQLERGSFRSVRQAAIAAGIVKEKSVVEKLASLWAKASDDERQAFLAHIRNQ